MDSTTIPKPRTSRWRPGRSFEEVWTNARAAFIGFLLGRGYSSFAIAEVLGDGTDPATVRLMANKWDLRVSKGKSAEVHIVIPMKQRDRAHLYARAQQRGISLEEYCRRLLVCGSMPRDRYDDLVAPDQFE